ncbi:hypothetical protein MMC31_007599 [Peltigera leucophlebia]|nr:hypothetical protein [Peltigera leucophlebia]
MSQSRPAGHIQSLSVNRAAIKNPDDRRTLTFFKARESIRMLELIRQTLRVNLRGTEEGVDYLNAHKSYFMAPLWQWGKRKRKGPHDPNPDSEKPAKKRKKDNKGKGGAGGDGAGGNGAGGDGPGEDVRVNNGLPKDVTAHDGLAKDQPAKNCPGEDVPKKDCLVGGADIEEHDKDQDGRLNPNTSDKNKDADSDSNDDNDANPDCDDDNDADSESVTEELDGNDLPEQWVRWSPKFVARVRASIETLEQLGFEKLLIDNEAVQIQKSLDSLSRDDSRGIPIDDTERLGQLGKVVLYLE